VNPNNHRIKLHIFIFFCTGLLFIIKILYNMERLVNEIIKLLDSLYKNGQLNNYFIEGDERKWVNLIKDILTVKFDFPWGNDTAELAQEIYDEYIVAWKGQQKFKGMLHTESKNTIRLTESELKSVISESVKQVISELDWKTYANAAKKAHHRALGYDDEKERDRAYRFSKAAEHAFSRDHDLDDYPYFATMRSRDRYTDVPCSDTMSVTARAERERDPYGAYCGVSDHMLPDDFRKRYKDAQDEVENYKKGNYEYTKGRGWHLKDNE
jgi:hypothetical protein